MSKHTRFYNNKVAVITGAGSGIGRAIARQLGEYGARVHCVDINALAAETTARQIEGATPHCVDVSDAAAVAALADQVFNAEDRVDLLFNNAGVGHAGLVVDTELADWRWIMDINVMGVVHGLDAFLPRMQRQPGQSRIINTASGAGLIPMPRMAPYCASKFAVVGLSQSLASELHGGSVGITILCPGTINTDIIKKTQTRGAAQNNQARAVTYYEQKGASPDQVAADVLRDVRKGRLFCVTPRHEVGLGWLLQRLSPTLTGKLLRAHADEVLGPADGG